MNKTYPKNKDIVDLLERIADLLEAQEANRYRFIAYRHAARVISELNNSVSEIVLSDDGRKLEDLPDIGKSIAGAIRQYVNTGHSGLLERLEGQISPEDLFTTIPGIGEKLAHRIHSELGIDTLEELELAVFDGRLQAVSGIGHRRVNAIRDSVSAILNRSSRRRSRRIRQLEQAATSAGAGPSSEQPSVTVILEVDEAYRQRASASKLKTIAPRRFNPEGKYWLPIMHTEKNDWHFTALFSNTARAHQLNKTRDWVVVFFEKAGFENQCTVVTEHSGPLKGRRVVRGREKECSAFYSQIQ
jgi:hypothetical protein